MPPAPPVSPGKAATDVTVTFSRVCPPITVVPSIVKVLLLVARLPMLGCEQFVSAGAKKIRLAVRLNCPEPVAVKTNVPLCRTKAPELDPCLTSDCDSQADCHVPTYLSDACAATGAAGLGVVGAGLGAAAVGPGAVGAGLGAGAAAVAAGECPPPPQAVSANAAAALTRAKENVDFAIFENLK